MELTRSSYKSHWLSDIEIPLANKFYRMHGFRGKAKRYEDCAVVRNEKGEVVACGYLRRYETFKLLSGVAVAPQHQGRGVARRLLELLAEKFDRDTYTFPYEHLRLFYESIGFHLIESGQLGEPVARLYQNYRNQGRTILVMGFQG
ncbi:GNAT family N-acetyltransferase [Microbulbifer sp. GL-2]|uniref:GNAT family N-acetyltransferase n=1 Tax=Microbulbifer sp. GL-2 TaxID=2591606 RepID=UPI00116249F2|nr:GNAT family N-acetyltransferase [Microbulbifer sp. GL-2]BBM02490.1 hypothetical protein GL2_25640 [Microbulbifer sp. GL-2]